jgi:hypothetical protein
MTCNTREFDAKLLFSCCIGNNLLHVHNSNYDTLHHELSYSVVVLQLSHQIASPSVFLWIRCNWHGMNVSLHFTFSYTQYAWDSTVLMIIWSWIFSPLKYEKGVRVGGGGGNEICGSGWPKTWFGLVIGFINHLQESVKTGPEHVKLKKHHY